MADSTLTSLSDFHDYEPDLEFDDSWMVEAAISPAPTELEAFAETETVMAHSASDGTIEENFEEELALPRSYEEWQLGFESLQTENNLQIASGDVERYSRLVRAGFLEVAGEDQSGCLIVIITACNLPPTNEVAPDIVLKYLVFTLDKFVESDYSIIYLHHGLRNESRPPFIWFWGAYKLLERKFKKNLKGLYLVHPTQMLKIIWKMLRPLISAKFGKKLKPCYHLHELRSNFRLDQLPIPESVLEYDRQLLANDPKAALAAAAAVSAEASRSNASASTIAPPPTKEPDQIPTQQIGVSLDFIRRHNPDMQDSIPPIVRYCVEFLSKPENIATEGIFRRSMAMTTLTRMVAECNRGDEVNFNNDPHCAAMLLKAFLRELDEPILTHQLFEEILRFNSWPIPQRPRMTKILLLEKLPLENYKLLKYIIQFLWRVADMSCLNKMTISNLAVVFGPNMLWPSGGGQFSLNFVIPINQFTEYILQHQEDLFII